MCPTSKKPCAGSCGGGEGSFALSLGDGSVWAQPKDAQQLLSAVKNVPQNKSYKLVAGNTGKGKRGTVNQERSSSFFPSYFHQFFHRYLL